MWTVQLLKRTTDGIAIAEETTVLVDFGSEANARDFYELMKNCNNFQECSEPLKDNVGYFLRLLWFEREHKNFENAIVEEYIYNPVKQTKNEWYTVNYRKVDEFDIDKDYNVLSIDFSDEDRATQFYKDIVEGNDYGEGYRAELIYYTDNGMSVLANYEW